MRRFYLPMALVSWMLFPQLPALGSGPELAPPAPTKKETATDTYFSTTVRDDYRWLERHDDPEVKAWAKGQNTQAQSYLAALPGRAQLAAQVKKFVSSTPLTFGHLRTVGGKIFAFKYDPSKQQKFVVLLDSPDHPGGGSAAWTKDGKGIFYTRYPREGERPIADAHFFQQVFFHHIGTPESEDVYSVGKEFPKIAEVQLESNVESDYVVATVANGDGGDFEHFVFGPDKRWVQFTKFGDKVKKGVLAFGPTFYAISLDAAPHGKIVKFALDASEIKPEAVVSPMEGIVQEVAVSGDEILIHSMDGGPSGLNACTLDGSSLKAVPLPPISNIAELVAGKDLVLFNIGSYTELPKWFRYEANGNRLAATALNSEPPFNFADLEVTRDFAVSKDGTKIPLNIIHKKGIALDRGNPTILYGYGGFGLSETPAVSLPLRAWYDLGRIFVAITLT